MIEVFDDRFDHEFAEGDVLILEIVIEAVVEDLDSTPIMFL